MSGLLESIARRRRASASRRLGPPANGIAPAPPGDAPEPAQPPGASQLNGAGPAAETETAPGASPASPESRPSPAAEAESGRSPAAEAEGFEPEQHSETELTRPASDAGEGPDSAEAAAQPEAVAEPEPEPEAVAEPEPEPEAVAEPEPEPEAVAEPEPEAVPKTETDPEPEAGLPASAPTFLERGRIRRRARYLRQLREIQLRDIGGFMLELQRFGRDRPDLVQAKLAGAASSDRELRVLERALGEPVPVRQLREAGIGGACSHCGAVYSSVDRFCSWCGTALSQNDEQPTQSADPDAPPSAL